MNRSRCLYCYQPLQEKGVDFHPACSNKLFGRPIPPALDYTQDQMLELAEHVIKSHTTVTGVQPKLSLGIERLKGKGVPEKLTIMGVWGGYILKPPTEVYPHLPELEDLTMHLAEIAQIQTVPHGLIRLQSGELAYITKRIDREGKRKHHMEDMCQLTGRLTEAKYRGSYEQIGQAIVQHSANPGFDLITFFEQVLFCFLTGNNDMHFKNFSLFRDPKLGYALSPAYDMVAATLVVEGDEEELALTLNGKKKKISMKDFEVSMGHFAPIDQRACENIFSRLSKAIPQWHDFIEISYVHTGLKDRYHQLIDDRARQIQLR